MKLIPKIKGLMKNKREEKILENTLKCKPNCFKINKLKKEINLSNKSKIKKLRMAKQSMTSSNSLPKLNPREDQI